MPLFAAPLIYGTTLAVSIPIFAAVCQNLPVPYLDEVFHAPLTQRYIATLDLTQWDPMITTPPGLYWLATLYSYGLARPVIGVFRRFDSAAVAASGGFGRMAAAIAALDFGDLWVLRSLNLVGALVILPVVLNLLYASQTALQGAGKKQGTQRKQQEQPPVETSYASIIMFPLVYFFAFLYYTDVWSAILVLAALAVGQSALAKDPQKQTFSGSVVASQVRWIFASAILALLSLTFRQTNIVWAGYVALTLLEIQANKTALNQPQSSQPPTFVARLGGIVSTALDWRSPVSRAITLGYGAVAAAFIAFLVWNNGAITLGDQAHHQISANIGQIFYLALHAAFFFGPPLAIYAAVTVARTGQLPVRPKSAAIVAVGFVVSSILVAGALHTVAFSAPLHPHPFTLADNRHYTFYLWRRVLSPCRASFGAALVRAPVFTAGFAILIAPLALAFTSSNKKATTVFSILAFIAAIAATLIPSPLLEPRYYIVPLVLWRVCHFAPTFDSLFQVKESEEDQGHVPEKQTLLDRIVFQDIEFLYYGYINVITLIVFLCYPFTWASEPGMLQRFMW